MKKCYLCPRGCGVERSADSLGFCAEERRIVVSRASLHLWEEPPISGERGSGAIFFCGCNLKCVFCQNKKISRGGGKRYSLTSGELTKLMLSLEEAGAHNINLVTPTHFADLIVPALEQARRSLRIPVVYNSSGYERVDTLRSLEGLVDIYLPDLKYASAQLAMEYSAAADYPQVAKAAISEMFRQVGEVTFDEDGMMRKGVIVRHLALPGCRKDSIAVLDTLAQTLPISSVRLSLMSQYTPEFALDCKHKNLRRRLTSFEYNSILSHAEELGFEGYFQSLASATDRYTPDFDEDCNFLRIR